MRHGRPGIRWLGSELAKCKLAGREIRTELLYTLIAKYFAAATRESGWHRKKIIGEAAKTYGVSPRTVETAISERPDIVSR